MIDDNKVIHLKIIENSANGENFIDFIKEGILKLGNNKKYYLLLDNARIHHYRVFKDFISSCPNLECIYNVPYSPEYNPIEHIFNEAKNFLKNKSICNKTIKKNIIDSFNKVKSKNIKNYYKKSLNFTKV